MADHLIEVGRSMSVPIALDVLLPSELASGLLVQVAGAPILNLVFKDLIGDNGVELYLRDAEDFHLIGRGPLKAHEVSDMVRQHSETFLG